MASNAHHTAELTGPGGLYSLLASGLLIVLIARSAHSLPLEPSQRAPSFAGPTLTSVQVWAFVDIAKATPIASPTPTLVPTATLPPTSTSLPTETQAPPPAATIAAPGDTVIASVAAPDLPANYNGGKYILVRTGKQHLYAYDNGSPIFSYVVSTGSGNSTRAGTFRVLDKLANAYGADWNFWMPNWLGIYWVGALEDGIHAPPLLSGGGRLWADALGTPVSYGCVVLGVDDAMQLFNWADVGTPVEISR
jgi:lipoprotein-anchoring transpeptidase ErfK/SrfK